ncbi:MAG: hypothetical protein JWQ96_1626 [Segetibacter sp.]|nr:hypothetical protein [Segetibacter sp.]
MKKILTAAAGAVVVLASCGKAEVNQKVLIISKGDITANGNNITIKGSSGSADKLIELSDAAIKTLNVDGPNGKTTINLPGDKGFYVLNLRTDSLVGSEQKFGTDISSSRTISQEEIKAKIDSLTKLTKGENVAAGANYLIAPNEIEKISGNTHARVFGPFVKIPGTLDAEPGGAKPEIYKFYTTNEMREQIKKFVDMTSAAK